MVHLVFTLAIHLQQQQLYQMYSFVLRFHGRGEKTLE